MTKPIEAYRQHSAVCNTVTFSPWVDEKVQPLRPGRTADTPRRRPKRVKPKIYEYEDEAEKTAGVEKLAIRVVDRTVNTMARPRDDKSVITATIMGTETSMQRTPALPDPDAPEDGSVRVAGLDLDAFIDEMAKASEFKSDAQRRWMYANEPEMAEEWQEETPKGKDLPEKVARTMGAVMKGVGLLAPDVKRKLEEEAEEWDVRKALHNLGMGISPTKEARLLPPRKNMALAKLGALKSALKMRKVAEEFDTPLLPTAMGGALGAAGGHMFPTAPAGLLRETAGKMVESPAQRRLLDKALRRNAWRVAKGTGAGLLGGALLHGLLKDSPDVY